MRRADSKTALGHQRAELRQGARHPQFVGQTASAAAAGKAAERERVRRMQEEQERARREAQELEEVIREQGRRQAEESWTAVVTELVVDSVRLARAFATFPFRLLAAIRHRRD